MKNTKKIILTVLLILIGTSFTFSNVKSQSTDLICKGDYNSSDTIDSADLTTFSANYKKQLASGSCALDITGNDCYLGIDDFSIFAKGYNRTDLCKVAPTDPGDGGGITEPTAIEGIWISKAEIQALPMTGAAWQKVLTDANKAVTNPTLADQEDLSNVYTYAKALAYVRTGDQKYLTGVIDALKVITYNNTEDQVDSRTLSVARELGAYVIAADTINLKQVDPTLNTAFKTKISALLTKKMAGRNGVDNLWDTAMTDPSNWGNHARWSAIAVVRYLGDDAKLDQLANRFQDWAGRGNAAFKFNELWWHCDQAKPLGINPDCTISGHPVGGVLPDDNRRCGTGFAWPPCKTGYQWEGLQGAFAAAELLHRAGYDSYAWQNQALLRAINFLYNTTFDDGTNNPAEADDVWILWMVNKRYNKNFSAAAGTSPGKNIGYTDWTIK